MPFYGGNSHITNIFNFLIESPEFGQYANMYASFMVTKIKISCAYRAEDVVDRDDHNGYLNFHWGPMTIAYDPTNVAGTAINTLASRLVANNFVRNITNSKTYSPYSLVQWKAYPPKTAWRSNLAAVAADPNQQNGLGHIYAILWDLSHFNWATDQAIINNLYQTCFVIGYIRFKVRFANRYQ